MFPSLETSIKLLLIVFMVSFVDGLGTAKANEMINQDAKKHIVYQIFSSKLLNMLTRTIY